METTTPPTSNIPRAHERLLTHGPQGMSDADLLAVMLGSTNGANSTVRAAHQLLEGRGLNELAWMTADELRQIDGIGPVRAAAISAAFELGRRGAWSPPKRGERCLDPDRVYELTKYLAFKPRESFAIVMLDVRGRLLGVEVTAEGSLTQCPVAPRDVLRVAVRAGAHGVVFVHTHPSGDPTPSVDDVSLTDRLVAACDLVGLVPRDHVVIAPGARYSFVEAGRWRR